MKLANGINFGAWLIVAVNLLMAFGAIGVFNRMTPAIANILSNNERSLEACEEMLATLVLAGCQKDKTLEERFRSVLERAKSNITESEEPEVLETIGKNYQKAFAGDKNALRITTESIIKLGVINRRAMDEADKRARQFGRGGAWGIVFMAVCSFLAGLIFIRKLNQKVLQPLDEIKNVLTANLGGETRRRCAGANLPGDIRAIFGNLNTVLDRSTHDTFRRS